MIDELQGTNAVGDPFEVIAQAMGEIVERINAPGVAGVMVGDMANAVEQGIAQPDIRRSHVDLRAKAASAVRKFTGLHAREQVEIFRHAAVAEWAVFSRTIR